MTVQTLTRPAASETACREEIIAPAGLDMDAIDHALDRGDLDTVRRLLGISTEAWSLLLTRL